MLEPSITTKPELTIVGFEAAFVHALSPDATNLQVIGPLWCKFLGQAQRIPSRVSDEMYGVIYGRPAGERSHPDELQYVAGVPVSSASAVPDGMTSHVVPLGEFAVFTHRGPIAGIGETMHEIYRVWLPDSEFEHADVADVELYDHRFKEGGDDSELEYWVSVRRKAVPR